MKPIADVGDLDGLKAGPGQVMVDGAAKFDGAKAYKDAKVSFIPPPLIYIPPPPIDIPPPPVYIPLPPIDCSGRHMTRTIEPCVAECVHGHGCSAPRR